MAKDDFAALLTRVSSWVGDRPLDSAFQRDLEEAFPAHEEFYQTVLAVCQEGDKSGWIWRARSRWDSLWTRDQTRSRHPQLQRRRRGMEEIAGPHHVHPNGEIDLILPVRGDARFDQQPAGWFVYGSGSAHVPTVAGGKAYVLYLLPGGVTQFTK